MLTKESKFKKAVLSAVLVSAVGLAGVGAAPTVRAEPATASVVVPFGVGVAIILGDLLAKELNKPKPFRNLERHVRPRNVERRVRYWIKKVF